MRRSRRGHPPEFDERALEIFEPKVSRGRKRKALAAAQQSTAKREAAAPAPLLPSTTLPDNAPLGAPAPAPTEKPVPRAAPAVVAPPPAIVTAAPPVAPPKTAVEAPVAAPPVAPPKPAVEAPDAAPKSAAVAPVAPAKAAAAEPAPVTTRPIVKYSAPQSVAAPVAAKPAALHARSSRWSQLLTEGDYWQLEPVPGDWALVTVVQTTSRPSSLSVQRSYCRALPIKCSLDWTVGSLLQRLQQREYAPVLLWPAERPGQPTLDVHSTSFKGMDDFAQLYANAHVPPTYLQRDMLLRHVLQLAQNADSTVGISAYDYTRAPIFTLEVFNSWPLFGAAPHALAFSRMCQQANFARFPSITGSTAPYAFFGPPTPFVTPVAPLPLTQYRALRYHMRQFWRKLHAM